MKTTLLAYLRLLLAGFLAYVAGGLSVWWLGTSWWSVLGAVLAAITVYAYAAPIPALLPKREVPGA